MKKHPPSAALRRESPPADVARWLGLLFGLLLLGLLALPARAAEAEDPPDRVGRLAELHGQVWLFSTDSNEWIAAVRNRPVTTGDRLSTEADGRAEIRIGSSVLRLAPNTEIDIQRLDDDRIDVALRAGSMTARLRTREAAREFGLVTDEGHFRTDSVGNYRFDRIGETSHATALSGQATYESDGTALAIMQGQHVEFWRERGGPQYAISNPVRDEFSTWVAARDGTEDTLAAQRYVSPEMTGVEDLDRYGAWQQTAEYGTLWTPRVVVAGWAPYRMGHWAWVRPWGWTWVDDAPWGFAPFHYGRWVYYRNNWCWAPGRYVARPVYAPALVAWMGGPGVSVSVRVGSAPTVGWFPLGPREVYVPGYRVSPRYVQQVNVTHVTNITNVTTIINNPGQYMANAHYANRGVARAVTVVPATVIERRQPVAPSIARVNDHMLRDLARDRPRADAPVTAPPRWSGGSNRPVAADPRVSRPGFATNRPGPNPGANPNINPGMPPRGHDNDGPDRGRPPAVGGAPAPRPQQEPPRIVSGGRDNPMTPPSPPPGPPGANTLPQVNQPGWAAPRDRDGRGGQDDRNDRDERSRRQPPRETIPDRTPAPPPPIYRTDERRQHHEMPGPPPRPVQAPQMQAPQPQVQAPQVQQPQIQPPVVRQPPPLPSARQNREQAPPQQQQQQQQQQEGRQQRGGGGDDRPSQQRSFAR